MCKQISSGEMYFIVENGHLIQEVKVVKTDGDFAVLRCQNGCVWLRLRRSRLYSSKEAAQSSIPKPKQKIVLSHWK